MTGCNHTPQEHIELGCRYSRLRIEELNTHLDYSAGKISKDEAVTRLTEWCEKVQQYQGEMAQCPWEGIE
jgi:hypothetical protein